MNIENVLDICCSDTTIRDPNRSDFSSAGYIQLKIFRNTVFSSCRTRGQQINCECCCFDCCGRNSNICQSKFYKSRRTKIKISSYVYSSLLVTILDDFRILRHTRALSIFTFARTSTGACCRKTGWHSDNNTINICCCNIRFDNHSKLNTSLSFSNISNRTLRCRCI